MWYVKNLLTQELEKGVYSLLGPSSSSGGWDKINRLPKPTRGAAVEGQEGKCAIFFNDSDCPFLAMGFAHHFAQESMVTPKLIKEGSLGYDLIWSWVGSSVCSMFSTRQMSLSISKTEGRELMEILLALKLSQAASVLLLPECTF